VPPAVAGRQGAGGAAMRWFAIWLLLTAVYAGVQLLCRLAARGTPLFQRADLAFLLVIPAAQVVALALLAFATPRRRR
jgi:hypothetical protein